MTPPTCEYLTGLLGSPVSDITAVGGGDICLAHKARLADGRVVFVKSLDSADEGFFEAEAEGLNRLGAVRDGVAVPDVIAVNRHSLVLEWVTPGSPSPEAAERLGRALAATHRTDGEVFGGRRDGWIGTLPLLGGPWPDWAQMWGHGRLQPYLRWARDQGSVNARDAAAIQQVIDRLDDLAGPPEPPSLIHGDLWAGNVLWAADGHNRLVDPAAHGGHRETDLAMLALFGLPYLERVLASYREVWAPADGWRERIPLHQLHPVLVHAVLFGGSYGPQAGRLARQMLATTT